MGAVVRAKRKRRRRSWWRGRSTRASLRLLFVFVLLGWVKYVEVDRAFYVPNDFVYVQPGELGLTHEDVNFDTSDGLRLHGWWLPAKKPARGVVVHFHGNAANITNHLPLVHWLPEAGYHLLMFDYRGYGQSEGHPTRAGTVRDGHAACNYARGRHETDGLPLFVYGQSLGGAVGVVVAAERDDVAAVVAESTFSNYRKIAAAHARRLVGSSLVARHVAGWCISEGYEPEDYVPLIAPRPLLVIVAENDGTCFPELGRELYEAARQPKEFWEAAEADHMQVLDFHGDELQRRIIGLFERATPK